MSEATELETRQRIMGEINDLLYDAQGKPGTRAFNQTSMVEDVAALIQERDRLKAENVKLKAQLERYEDALIDIRTWERGVKGYSQEMVIVADTALNAEDDTEQPQTST